MQYEELLTIADREGLIVREKDLIDNDGRIKNNRVAIRRDMTDAQKACTLAEELGHYFMNYGDVMDLSDVTARKQEAKARLWAYNNMISFDAIVDAFEHGCRNRYEVAEYLEVTEEFLQEAIGRWSQIHGWIRHGQYMLRFDGGITIMKMF